MSAYGPTIRQIIGTSRQAVKTAEADAAVEGVEAIFEAHGWRKGEGEAGFSDMSKLVRDLAGLVFAWRHAP